jgi:hypothetical protein
MQKLNRPRCRKNPRLRGSISQLSAGPDGPSDARPNRAAKGIPIALRATRIRDAHSGDIRRISPAAKKSAPPFGANCRSKYSFSRPLWRAMISPLPMCEGPSSLGKYGSSRSGTA